MDEFISEVEATFEAVDPTDYPIEKPRGGNILHKIAYLGLFYTETTELLSKLPPAKAKELVNERDEQGDTPPMLAARLGGFGMLKLMVSDGRVADGSHMNEILRLARQTDISRPRRMRFGALSDMTLAETREKNTKDVEKIIKDNMKVSMVPQAKTLIAAEQTILRAPGQLPPAGLAPPGSALSKAMNTGILQSQVGKFLTSKPITGETVRPAIRDYRRDITGQGRKKRLSTRRKSKRNVRARVRYSRRNA